jgi:histidine phosphotransfer protein HptB
LIRQDYGRSQLRIVEKKAFPIESRDNCGCGERPSRLNHLKSEPFDPGSLLDRVDGDLELLGQLAAIFAEEAPRMLAQIGDAIHRGSASDLEKASHKIKGSVLQFSAGTAVAAALELEEKGRSGSVAGAEPLLNALRQEIELLSEALHSMICGDATC